MLYVAGRREFAADQAVVLGRRLLQRMEEMQDLLQGQTTTVSVIIIVRVFLLMIYVPYVTPSGDT